jgi:hypothetical protein
VTILTKLRDDEEFVITSLSKEFGGTSRVGENPPDAYLQIGAREIAVEISTLTQHITDDRGTRSRLDDDIPAIKLSNELDAELLGLLPDGQSVSLILSTPILKFRQTKTALAKHLREKLPDLQAFATETEIEINGNVIKVQRHDGHSAKKIWGVVPNRHSKPDILANARNILEDRISVKARKCAEFIGKKPLWLALLNDYWLSDAGTYKCALSSFSPRHPFEKIILVSGDGTVELLF